MIDWEDEIQTTWYCTGTVTICFYYIAFMVCAEQSVQCSVAGSDHFGKPNRDPDPHQEVQKRAPRRAVGVLNGALEVRNGTVEGLSTNEAVAD